MKFILDCDTGIDDTLALMYLCAAIEKSRTMQAVTQATTQATMHAMTQAAMQVDRPHELLGVVGTFGNVTEPQATANNRALLDALGFAAVPAYHGVPVPSFDSLRDEYEVDEGCMRFHGANGWGGAQLCLADEAERGDVRDGGVEFEAQAVCEFGDELTIIATGPLTNIDAMLTAYPDLASRLKLVIMGGAFMQPGNCYNLISETNIVNDPEAANRVFHSGADITIVGIDVTHRTLMTRTHMDEIAQQGGSAGAFVAHALSYYINANETADDVFLQGSPLHDPLAVGVAIDPSLVMTFPLNVQVDLDGPQRGRTVGDPTMINLPAGHVRVALDVDRQRFVSKWLEFMHIACQMMNSRLV